MFKRQLLVILLICFSLFWGVLFTLFQKPSQFFFNIGLLFILIFLGILFITTLIFWLILIRKKYLRSPEKWIRHQSILFYLWFSLHNISWALAGSLFIWGLIKIFGYKYWVFTLSAGGIACISFILMGSFIIRKWEMLGLCWQSQVPNGLKNYWERMGAAIIPYIRYESVVEQDQKKSKPLLWSISRIFNRSKTGGADRSLDLFKPNFKFLSGQLKKEWQHRLKSLMLLFWIAIILTAIPGLLGLKTSLLDQVPIYWPTDQIKESKAHQKPPSQKSVSDFKPYSTENTVQKENPNPKSSSKSESQGATDNSSKKDPRQSHLMLNQNQIPKNQSSINTNSKSQKSTLFQKNVDKKLKNNQKNFPKQTKESSGQKDHTHEKQSHEREKSHGNQEDSKERENPQRASSRTKTKEKLRSDTSQNKSSQTKEENKKQLNKKQGEGKPIQNNKNKINQIEELQNTNQQNNQSVSKGIGSEKSQVQGDPNHIPEMLKESKPIPPIPSRKTKMVHLQLPTLNDNQSNETSKNQTPSSIKKNFHHISKNKAPISPLNTGQQQQNSLKPDQYLPNWILNLISKK